MPRLPNLRPAPAILFVTATWIGDAVLSTALLRNLLERYEEPRFTIAAGARAASIFRCVPGLERLIGVTKRRYSLHWLDLLRRVGARRWDLVVDIRGSVLSWLLRTRHRRVIGKGQPDLHWVVQLGNAMGVSPPPAPTLWWNAAHEAAAQRLIPAEGPVLALGPAANWQGKQWPAERFAELLQRLTAAGGMFAHRPVAIFAAAHERDAIAPVLAAARGRCFEVIGEPDLLTVAAALSRTSVFIGNDSGLMHMAAAAGVPTLGLFGPTRSDRYGPWGPLAAVVQTDKPYADLVGDPSFDRYSPACLMETLSVDKVEAAALSLVRKIEASSGAQPRRNAAT